MKRVVTFTPNPCLDETVWLEGEREIRRDYQSGGKGLNVARVLAALGSPVVAMAPLGGATGKRVAELMQQEGAEVLALPCTGETRTVVTHVQQTDFSQQQTFHPGALLTPQDISRIIERISEQLADCSLLLLSGRLPENALKAGEESRRAILELYPTLIRLAHERGVPVWLDTHGPGFKQAFAAGPDFIKPNWEEATELAAVLGGRSATSSLQLPATDQPLEVDTPWAQRNCPFLLPLLTHDQKMTLFITLGEHGVLYWHQGGGVFYPPYQVKTVNPVGSGDSFIAGWLHGWLRGRSAAECMRIAQAAGAVNASMWAAAKLGKKELTVFDPTLKDMI